MTVSLVSCYNGNRNYRNIRSTGLLRDFNGPHRRVEHGPTLSPYATVLGATLVKAKSVQLVTQLNRKAPQWFLLGSINLVLDGFLPGVVSPFVPGLPKSILLPVGFG